MSASAKLLSPKALLPVGCLVVAIPGVTAADVRHSERYGELPLHFEQNLGQAHEDVEFLARGAGFCIYLTATDAVLVMTPPTSRAERGDAEQRARDGTAATAASAALRMRLVDAASEPHVSGLEPLPGTANYFIGNDPARWHTGIPTFAKVRYREVYPGIDLVYHGNHGELEYDFVIAPGADPARIVLEVAGAEQLEIDVGGALVLQVDGGAVRQLPPSIYQEIDGDRRQIDGGYVLDGANRVRFAVADYAADRPLIIDPILTYSSFLGGNGTDWGLGIALDASGSAYVTGQTSSSDFPTSLDARQTTRAGAGGDDVFVTKIDPTGSMLVYSTYLGGSGSDGGSAVAVDAAGYAYLTGETGSVDFPTTPEAFQPVAAGNIDTFVAKLDPTGAALVYSTYLGGSAHRDSGKDLAIDSGGHAYVVGWTRSADFPTTPGAAQTALHPGECNDNVLGAVPCYDVFVTKLDPAGTALLYSTYLGGTSLDFGQGIAVDALGSAFVTGQTFSLDYPTTAGAYAPSSAGSVDVFVSKLDPSGSTLAYSTYLGSSDHDDGAAIAIDGSGNAYVVGTTSSFGFMAANDFPTTPDAFQTTFGNEVGCPPQCSGDAFVTKLDAAGSSLAYSTYLGGTHGEFGSAIDVDEAGNAYVTGTTYSPNFPTTADAFQAALGGASDAFVTKLNPDGSELGYSTYLGGTLSDEDSGSDIAVNGRGSAVEIVVTGNTRERYETPNDFPTTPTAVQAMYGGGPRDAFVVKFVDAPPPTAGLVPTLPALAAPPLPWGVEAVIPRHAVPLGRPRPLKRQ